MATSHFLGRLAVGALTLLVAMVPLAPAASAVPSERVTGRVTKSNGEPAAGVWVQIVDVRTQALYRSAMTDATGSYVVTRMNNSGMNFKVKFTAPGNVSQWAYRKTSFADAATFTLDTFADTVVNEVLFPTGSLVVTARDKATGAPIDSFCAETSNDVSGRNGCTSTGSLTVPDLAPGEYRVTTTGDDHHFGDSARATVTADQATAVNFTLAPAAVVTTTMQDAATGAPVANACLLPVTGIGNFSNNILTCSGPDGRVTVSQMNSGSYRLFVLTRDSVHGAQWVGPNGGTGSRDSAKVIDVTVGGTVTVPPILLDGAGSISGTVVEAASGTPVAAVCAFSHAGGTQGGPDNARYCTGEDGRYTIDGLGPYEWPVHFIDTLGSHTWQWSGDQPTQSTARKVAVQVGQTTIEDAHLGVAATISGRVTNPDGQPVNGAVFAYNAVTGDQVANYAITDGNGYYQLVGIAGQTVRLQVEALYPDTRSVWYRTSSSFESADPVEVPAGGTVTGIDFVVPAG